MNVDFLAYPTLDTLKNRERIINLIRSFFRDRDVMEVSTPIANDTTTNEIFLDSLEVITNGENKKQKKYLHTSPEYAMKKLLARYPVSIYQICKVFRNNEFGAKHSVEFSMLEWYRVGLDVDGFIDEFVLLLGELFPTYVIKILSYGELFYKHFAINPYLATLSELNDYICSKKILSAPLDYKSECLDLLFSMSIEPSLVGEVFYFVKDFPVEQASLSAEKKLTIEKTGEQVVANRFELFARGMELANGYEELTDASVLEARMKEDIAKRKQIGKDITPLDEELIQAHRMGLPNMVGASLGIDRLVMLYLGLKNINEVIVQ